MRFGILVFPGSWSHDDFGYVLREVMGLSAELVWHKEETVAGYDCLILPGGFAHGDYLRCGAIARFSPVMEEVAAHAQRGGKVIGICNGFQVLTEAGLLPGVLLRNKTLKFLCQEVELEVVTAATPFTRRCAAGQSLRMPIAHGDGNYYLDDDGLKRLEGEGQVVFRYRSNPNGSRNDIAGVCNAGKNVLGMMPHPERAAEALLGSTDGRLVFESLLA